jgi:hypothetical protein
MSITLKSSIYAIFRICRINKLDIININYMCWYDNGNGNEPLVLIFVKQIFFSQLKWQKFFRYIIIYIHDKHLYIKNLYILL